MFKFTIVSEENVHNFYNHSKDFGIDGMSRFLTWLDSLNLNLPIHDIHSLIKKGFCNHGGLTMNITECEQLSDLLV